MSRPVVHNPIIEIRAKTYLRSKMDLTRTLTNLHDYSPKEPSLFRRSHSTVPLHSSHRFPARNPSDLPIEIDRLLLEGARGNRTAESPLTSDDHVESARDHQSSVIRADGTHTTHKNGRQSLLLEKLIEYYYQTQALNAAPQRTNSRNIRSLHTNAWLPTWWKARRIGESLRSALKRWNRRPSNVADADDPSVPSWDIFILQVNSKRLAEPTWRACLPDTGSPVNLVNEAMLSDTMRDQIKPYKGDALQNLGWWPIRPKGRLTLTFKFTEDPYEYEAEFLVLRKELGSRFDCLLGSPWLSKNGFVLQKRPKEGEVVD